MAIDTTVAVAAEKAFRSLDEVDRMVDDVKEDIDTLDNLLHVYESMSTSVQTAAIEFKINLDTKKNGAPRKRSPKIDATRLDKVVVPNVAELRKNFSVVEEMYDKLDVLKSLETTVNVRFKGTNGAGKTASHIRQMADNVRTKIQRALAFLERLANKHVPKVFTDFVQSVVDPMSEFLQYDKAESAVYMRELDGSIFEFTHYLRLINLTSEENAVTPQMFIVFTCRLTPVAGVRDSVDASFYVTTLHEFAVPGSFSVGVEVNEKSALLAVGTQLELENFSNSIGVLPLGIDGTKVSKGLFSLKNRIQSIEVDEHSMTFTLVAGVKSAEEANKIGQQLYLEVKSLVLKTRSPLKVRQSKELGRFKLRFSFAALPGSNQVSLQDLDFLKTKLGVDDDKLRKIVKVINGE